MKVELIDWTGSGLGEWHAAALLIWTKQTRVEMSPGGLEEIRCWPEEKKRAELEYMSRTIPSSWEFCDYTFLITGVTRAYTHQLVRTRTGSYAQQNHSVQKVKDWTYRTGPSIEANPLAKVKYEEGMEYIADLYDELNHEAGVKVEDARGILPTNIHSNIVVKWNLRVCCETFRKRASSERGHGEYHEVIALMREEVLRVHPWASIFLDRAADVVAREAYELIKQIPDKALRMELSKRIDGIMTGG